MSWSINYTGLRAQVKEQVLATQSLPATIKQAIVEIIDDPTAGPSKTNGIRVEGNGHGNDPLGAAGQWRASAKLTVEPTEILVPTPDPVPGP
jgi:hypothetical protein